jgi:signal transduction histidine kinase
MSRKRQFQHSNSSQLFIQIVVLAIAYFITAKFGLSINPVNGFATLVWLPSGISLAFLLIFGYKLWPAIFIGAFLANLSIGAPLFAALGIGVGNTLEPIIASFLLKNYFNFRSSLERLKDVLALVVVGSIMSTLVSASIGAFSLLLTGVIRINDLIPTWEAWWVGDMISDLVIAPIILVLSSKEKIKFSLIRIIEAFILIIIFIITYLLVFEDLLGLRIQTSPSAYLLFPALILTALRFGQPGAVIVIFTLSVLATLSTVKWVGPFATQHFEKNLLSLQLYMVVTSISTMILAAVITEREQLEKKKSEFVSIVAHELKTPVTTIKGYAQMLSVSLSKSKDKKALLFVNKMNSQIDNLTRLISDLFDSTKIESGKLNLQKESFNFDQMVKEVVEDVKHISSQSKIKIVGLTGAQIMADRYRICQVLTNLLSNAVKFSPKSAVVTIRLSSNKDHLKVDVIDRGIGIGKEDIKNIFQLFYQAKTDVKPAKSGLGLGLYISSQIIKHHGGEIWVKSQKGKGATFSFTLPFR